MESLLKTINALILRNTVDLDKIYIAAEYDLSPTKYNFRLKFNSLPKNGLKVAVIKLRFYDKLILHIKKTCVKTYL